jgi:peptidoglycan/xylan/chitin deacetylase (PgdA/CDA1 family)
VARSSNRSVLNFIASFCTNTRAAKKNSKDHTMSRTALLQTGFDTIYYSGAAKLLAARWGGMGVIFCLHHVKPGGGKQSGFAPNSNLEITPEFLADIIAFVQAKGYELLSLSDTVERIRQGQCRNRFAVFTLDDGYKDNLVHAMPVFKAAACPFTVYVAPRIAEGTCELWWRGLEAIIAKADYMKCKVGEFSFDAATASEAAKITAWRSLAPKLQALPEYEQRQTLRTLADRYDIDVDAQCRNVAMTWDEIRTMAAEPLATIGAHTLNHYNLLKLPEADARREIVESGARVADEIGKPVQHFAYPYGNKDAAGPREFKLCAEAGYTSSVVTRLGTVTEDYANHLQALPRIMVSGRFQNLRSIETLMSGVPGRLANGGRALNVR